MTATVFLRQGSRSQKNAPGDLFVQIEEIRLGSGEDPNEASEAGEEGIIVFDLVEGTQQWQEKGRYLKG